MKFIDLFAGLGGFRLALESLGHECVFASEIDQDCCDVYEINFGDRPAGDIVAISTKNISDHDILCGGFPCQSYSIAGKKQGFSDRRGLLFLEIARILREKQPSYFILENVSQLLTHNQGRTYQVIYETFTSAGYKVTSAVLNASDFGATTARTRLYFVGIHNRLGYVPFDFEGVIKEFSNDCLQGYLDPDVPSKYFVERDDVVMSSPRAAQPNNPQRVGYVGKGRQGERIYSPAGHAIAFTASGGGPGATSGLYLVDNKVRRLTPRECYRVMGFPDTYKISDKARIAYKQIGNSVVVPVIKAIMEGIGRWAARKL